MSTLSRKSSPIAIVGLACRLPGIDENIQTLVEFWQFLNAGQSPVSAFPSKRWTDKYDCEQIKGNFLNHIDLFDAAYFHLQPAEAKEIDPQHRLFLTSAIHALHHANIPSHSLAGSNVGVFCGISTHEYEQLTQQSIPNHYTSVGYAASGAAGRLAYHLDLRGPALAIDTACSSSLSALNVATHSLSQGECDTAIVGAVSLNLLPDVICQHTEAQMISPDGVARCFDEKANGYVRSDACVVLILKRLDDAIEKQDRIHGVIKGVSVKQDGRSLGFKAPSCDAQVALYHDVLNKAGLSPHQIDYVEAHAAGTPLGDPTEFKALQSVYAKQFDDKHPLIIGAVKSQMGHCVAASGLVGLLKILACFKYNAIPQNLNLNTVHHDIDLNSIPAHLPSDIQSWTGKDHTRYAMLNNFGFTGTIGSLIIESPPQVSNENAKKADTPCCFVLSAHTRIALDKTIEAYIDFLDTTKERLENICYTAAVGRDHHRLRLSIVAKSKKALAQCLRDKDYHVTLHTPDEALIPANADLEQLKRDFLSGKRIDFNHYYTHCDCQTIDLPRYEFDESPYWHDAKDSHSSHAPSIENEPIAIIGMSCRLPKADDLASFYTLLKEGLDGFQAIPETRWDNQKYVSDTPHAPLKHPVKEMAFIDDIRSFDPQFFGISPREAKFIDPQQRLFLENCYLALEHANIPSHSLAGSLTGVFAGIGFVEYYMKDEVIKSALKEHSSYNISGENMSFLPGRVSYTFDLRGPSEAFSTACSSSFLAIHHACESLRSHAAHLALAGGVQCNLSPLRSIRLSKIEALSPSSRCKTFDKDADGFAKGEGCGVLVLKRQSDAIRDGDNILAVINSSATNSDGKSEGLLQPNPLSQTALIKEVLSKSDLEEADIQYVEAHGTGTKIGDPIEVNAISTNFKHKRTEDNPLYIGSLKTNIGHLEAASGVASIIKTVIGLQSDTIFKHLNFNTLNPNIDLGNLSIPLETHVWQSHNNKRAALVNGFGFGGTNVAALIENAPVLDKFEHPSQDEMALLCLSAHSQYSLNRLIEKYIDYLSHTKNRFQDICYTAAQHRNHYRYRLVIKAPNSDDALAQLRNADFKIAVIDSSKALLSSPTRLEDIKQLYLAGNSINWQAYLKRKHLSYQRVDLPNYVFDKQDYWIDKQELVQERNLSNVIFPLLGEGKYIANGQYIFSAEINLESLHCANRSTADTIFNYPISAYLNTILEFMTQVLRVEKQVCIKPFHTHLPFICQNRTPYQIHFQQTKPSRQYHVSYYQTDMNDWLKQSEMSVTFKDDINLSRYNTIASSIEETFNNSALTDIQLKALQESSTEKINPFTNIKTLFHKKNRFWAILDTNPDILIADSAIQLVQSLLRTNSETPSYVSSIADITLLDDLSKTNSVLAKQIYSKGILKYALYLLDEKHHVIASIEELTFQTMSKRDVFYLTHQQNVIYLPAWEPSILQKQAVSHYQCLHPNPTLLDLKEGSNWYQSIDDIENITQQHVLYFFHEQHFLHLVNTTKSLLLKQPNSITFVTQNAYALKDDQHAVNPHHTSASSYWKSFGIEIGNIDIRQIDFSQTDALSSMLSFLSTHTLNEPQYAYRGKLFTPRLNQYQAPSDQLLNNRLRSIQNSEDNATPRCCLITGGTGALGQLLIDYLATKGIKHIYTTSRHRPSPAYRQLTKRLKRQSVHLYHIRTNICKKENIKKLLDEIQFHHQINAIYHLAGVTNDAMIINANEKNIQQVLETKAYAAWHLHELTQHIDLDAFVLFSSTTGFFGASGQSSYAAANGFLDGLSHLRRSMHLPCLSINWGPWYELGMAKGLHQHHQRKGNIPLLPQDIYLLDLLLAQTSNQVICNRFDWQLLSSKYRGSSLFSNIEKTNKSFTEKQLNKPLTQAGDIARRVLEIVCYVLSIRDSSTLLSSETLYQYGLDSLLSFEIRNQLHQSFKDNNLQLPVEIFLIAPTIDSITKAIHQSLSTKTPLHSKNRTGITAPPKRQTLPFQLIPPVLVSQMGFPIEPMSTRYCLKGQLDVSLFKQAFQHVYSHQLVFALSIMPNQLSYQVKDLPPFDFHFLELDNINPIDQTLSAAFYKQCHTLSQSAITHRLSVYLYQCASDTYELHIYMNHIMADEFSFIILLKQVEALYRTLIEGKPLPKTDVNMHYLDYIQRSNEEFTHDAEKKVQFWQAYNKKKQLFSPHYTMFNTKNISDNDYLTQFLIDDSLLKSFFSALNHQKLNPHYSFVSLVYMALHSVRKQPPFNMSVVEDMRSHNDKQSIGFFIKRKILLIPTNSTHSFIQLLKQVENEAMRVAEFQSAPTFLMMQPRPSILKKLFSPVMIRYLKHYRLPELNALSIPEGYKPALYDFCISNLILQVTQPFYNWINKRFSISKTPSKFRGLNIVLNIYRSFIYEDLRQYHFPNIDVTENQHLVTLDQHISDQELYILLSRDLEGRPILSINAGITHACKTDIAKAFITHLKNAIAELDKLSENTLF